MVRIEVHLTEEESAIIKEIAKKEGRSRKKQCEVYLKEIAKGKIKTSTN